ncbi:hypothetical protein I7I50_00557 [Histoplasma capsulatum G186AR]|uniref:Uncharacterized protein n=1 Tax=Ajellomyces capsulatus TaxID=5037 RepID=A0A8H7YJ69_AJECA|nr:hypothetical protein I7I52_07825 [Histoplasma capsulatum]QSS72643.1 hypothetical protein I7I50_00557 [Histoplasma capsulatum G186AR]
MLESNSSTLSCSVSFSLRQLFTNWVFRAMIWFCLIMMSLIRSSLVESGTSFLPKISSIFSAPSSSSEGISAILIIECSFTSPSDPGL